MIVLDLDRALGAQDLVEIDRAEQLEGRIDDEDLAEPVGQVLVLAHVVDGLADRPERRHGDELRLHAPAGGFFRIVERPPQPDPLGERQLRQDLVLVLLVEVFQDVDRVVGIEFLDRLRRSARWAGCRRCRGGSPRRPRSAPRSRNPLPRRSTSARRCSGMQRFEQVAELGLVQARRRRCFSVSVSRSAIAAPIWARKDDADDAVLAIDIGARDFGCFGAGLLDFRWLPTAPPVECVRRIRITSSAHRAGIKIKCGND